jgi:hypothetical protein
VILQNRFSEKSDSAHENSTDLKLKITLEGKIKKVASRHLSHREILQASTMAGKSQPKSVLNLAFLKAKPKEHMASEDGRKPTITRAAQ